MPMCDSGGKTGKRANRGRDRQRKEKKKKKRERRGRERKREKANYRAFCWYIKL